MTSFRAGALKNCSMLYSFKSTRNKLGTQDNWSTKTTIFNYVKSNHIKAKTTAYLCHSLHDISVTDTLL
jgi:hypothetical protein